MVNYPAVKHSQVEDDLKQAYPVWLLTPHGIVVGANQLTKWLWQIRQFNDLLGSNAFAIFSNNLRRIPKHTNREFFAKKSMLVKRMSDIHGSHHYAPFIHAMKEDPDLKNIYEWKSWEPETEWASAEDEWQYKLHIGHPGKGTPDNKLLTFHVTVSRHEESGGFLIRYVPHNDYTIKVVRQQYQRLSAQRDSEYVQYHKGAVVTAFNKAFQEKFREAMLRIIQSPGYSTMLEDFRTAYEYRRKFPWLDESSKDGLSYALQAALASYIVHKSVTAEELVAPRGFGEETDSSIDSGWAERLRIAVDATIKESFSLERFEKRLARAGVDIDTIPPYTLQGYIVDALERFYNRRMIGLSPDPI